MSDRHFDNYVYEMCQHCDHFVERNDCKCQGMKLSKFVHLDDGSQEFDHDAAHGIRHKLRVWKRLRPDLFKHHRDGKIGPNSIHHSRRGKNDEK